MTAVLGIDPGLKGALAVLDDDILHTIDIPTLTIKVGKTAKRQLDMAGLAGWFMTIGVLADIDHAVIENPHAMPGQGVSSSFKFGFVCGALQAFVAAQRIPVTLVRPRVWKQRMGLTKDKDACRLVASQLMPSHAHLWPLKKHDGRAEAALLAYYGVHKL